MDYYFDTSALIELCKDPDRDCLVEAIWGKIGTVPIL
jgi:hypothetical protein